MLLETYKSYFFAVIEGNDEDAEIIDWTDPSTMILTEPLPTIASVLAAWPQ